MHSDPQPNLQDFQGAILAYRQALQLVEKGGDVTGLGPQVLPPCLCEYPRPSPTPTHNSSPVQGAASVHANLAMCAVKLKVIPTPGPQRHRDIHCTHCCIVTSNRDCDL